MLRKRRRRPFGVLTIDVCLGDGHHARHLFQARLVRPDLALNELIVSHGVGRHAIYQVQQHTAAADVLEELEPQPVPLAGALHESRQVGHREPVISGVHDPQHRLQCGERVGRDLRLCVRHGGQQGGLTGVRQSQQPDIGQQP